MKISKQRIAVFFFFIVSSNFTFASQFGISVADILSSHEPTNMKGYRAAVTYLPDCLNQPRYSVYFDVGFSHLWVNTYPYHSLSVYSIAPYIRYFFKKTSYISPYIEASVGFAYLTKLQLQKRPQGIHFTFQDQAGLGLAYGKEQQFFTTLSAMHYSNGSFSEQNSGLTATLMLTAGYRF